MVNVKKRKEKKVMLYSAKNAFMFNTVVQIIRIWKWKQNV